MRALIFGLCLAVLNCSCAWDVANRYYAPERYPPTPIDRVEVLTSEPGSPYVIIAEFQSRGDTPQSLRKKAAKVGADAVIVTKLGGTSEIGEEWAEQQSEHGSYDHIVGIAIKYGYR